MAPKRGEEKGGALVTKRAFRSGSGSFLPGKGKHAIQPREKPLFPADREGYSYSPFERG